MFILQYSHKRLENIRVKKNKNRPLKLQDRWS